MALHHRIRVNLQHIAVLSLLLVTVRVIPNSHDDRLMLRLVKKDAEIHLGTLDWLTPSVFAELWDGASLTNTAFTQEGIIQRWGYAVEMHNVTTQDGYILTIFRIPRARNQVVTPRWRRPVVLFQHGLFGSSDMWVSNLPNQDAAFLYADAGYDVWLGNFRGNIYGKSHVTLSPIKDKMTFWDFSWPEMAKYDLPAMINYITWTSKAPHLYYVGHSMGTLTGFVQFSQDQEFAKKVKKFYALGPVMKVEHLQGVFRVLAMSWTTIDNALYYTGTEELFPPSQLNPLFAQYVCGGALLGDFVCANGMSTITGPNSNQLNTTRLPVYLAHTPASTSRRTFGHFGQMYKSGKIAQYDFGYSENKKRYGTATPPEYDVSRMETPVALCWGSNDWLANDQDVRNMIAKLKNVFAKVYLKDFNHMDFLWGQRATKELYIPIQQDILADFSK